MEHLITRDDSGRLVPTDRAALARAVGLLDGPLGGPGPLRRAGLGLLALGRHEEAVAVHIHLGDAHRCAGAPDAAGPHYRQALRLAEEHAPDLLSFCCRHLGKHRLELGRTEEARECLGEALRLVDRAGRPARRRSAPGGAAGPSAG